METDLINASNHNVLSKKENTLGTEAPALLQYFDYRAYLQDHFNYRKTKNSNYSLRYFMNKGGLTSPGHLNLIINGQRNLTHKTLPKYIKALGLKKKAEVEYFQNLVHYCQESQLTLKLEYFEKLMDLRKASLPLHNFESEHYEFLSQWYFAAIYVLTDFKSFQEDPHWICQRLQFRITPEQAKKALELLKKVGLLIYNDRQELCQANNGVTIPDHVMDLAILKYHHSMTELAKQAIDTLPPERRELNGLSLSISEDMLPLLKQRIRQFRDDINSMSSRCEHPDQAYQLNIHLFALTKEGES